MQLSYSPAQTRGRKIMDDDDISIYTPEELERLESLQVWEFVHTRVYDVNLLKKWRWTCFVMTFRGSPLQVEGIRQIEHTMEG
jgi:hypothetical protein